MIKKTSANGIEIAWKEYGSGEPLLMITGFSATMDMWPLNLISELAKNYRVIIFDNRGAGFTGSDDSGFSIPLFAKDTNAFLNSIGVDSAHIFGWSMGTNIALELEAKHPEKVGSLILYAADCGGDEAVLPDSGVYSLLGDTSGTESERGMRLLSLLFPKEWLKTHPDIFSYFPKVSEFVSAETVNAQYMAMEKWNGVYSELSRINKPVLLITGTDDVLTPPENSFLIAKEIAGSWLIQMKNSGHGAMYQYPEKMASAVGYFLSSEVFR